MKKIFRKGLAAIFLIAVISNNNVIAQDLILPVDADTALTTSNVSIQEINNAVYTAGNTLLYGVAWRDGAGNCGFVIRDNSQTMPYQAITPIWMYDLAGPDIVIGAPYNLSTEYYVGVVYSTNLPVMDFHILLDVYKIEYVLGVPTITGSNIQIPIAQTSEGIGLPHIDLINKQISTLYYSDKFVITWSEVNSGVTSVEACSGSLIDAYNNGATNIIYASNTINDLSNITGGYNPDVAGIERTINSNIEDIAYITFTDNNGYPYVTEWIIDPLGGTVNYDNTPKDMTSAEYIRIDGLDPHTQGGNGEDYCLVYQYNASGTRQVKSYTPGGVVTNTQTAYNSADQISTSDAYCPNIICGPGNNYSVMFYTHGIDQVIMQPMDWYNSFNNTCSCITNSNQDYFQVPTSGAPWFSMASACGWKYNSGSGKVEPSIAMLAWADFGTLFIPEIDYKLFFDINSAPFKQATNINIIEEKAKLTIYPNPATDKLNIVGQTKEDTYVITDVTGRKILDGISKSNSLSIASLQSGTYILEIENQKLKFVKE